MGGIVILFLKFIYSRDNLELGFDIEPKIIFISFNIINLVDIDF